MSEKLLFAIAAILVATTIRYFFLDESRFSNKERWLVSIVIGLGVSVVAGFFYGPWWA